MESVIKIIEDVKSGSKSASDYLEGFFEKIEAQDSEINSFNTLTKNEAFEKAQQIDSAVAAGEKVGPLAGVPIAIKDILCTQDIETTCSSKILKGWKPPYDATSVAMLKDAGAVIVGKTNCDEFAMGGSNENSAYGPVKNPRDVGRVPGGSSGGSAAAVAAEFVPASIGSDTGGSVRQPASLCGVVGLKPTYGAISRYGLIAFASSLDTVGVFANNVSDTAYIYDQITGHDFRDSTSLPDNPGAIYDQVVSSSDLDGLRVGVIQELNGSKIDGFQPEVIESLNKCSDTLISAGAKVDEVSIPAIEACVAAYYMIVPAEASSNLARFDGVRFGNRVEGEPNTAEMMKATRSEGFGSEVKRRIMLGTYALSAGYYDAYYAKAQKLRGLLIDELNKVFDNFDVLLSPTSPCVAFPFGAKEDPVSMYVLDIATCPVNLAGLPGISVPFGKGEADMPIGMQFIGPKFGEATICKAGLAVEGKNND